MTGGTPSGRPTSAGTGAATEPGWRTHWGAVITFALATLIVSSELSMASLALPLIGTGFGVDSSATAWVLLAYSLPLAALAIPAGRWMNRANVRFIFLFSLVGVGLADVVAGFAPVFWLLLASRVVQGLAAAVFLALYLPIVASSVRANQRGRAMSYMTTIMTLGSVAVAPLGGLLAASFGWRSVFLIKVPFVALVLWLGFRTIPAGQAAIDGTRRVPLPSRSVLWEVLLLGGALTAVLLAVERIKGQWTVAAAFALAAVVLALFWTRLAASRPLLALVRRRTLGLPVLSLMLMACMNGLVVFSLPFFVADVMGQTPEVLGIAVLSFVGTMGLISPVAGALADRYSPLPIAAAGSMLTACGMLTMLTLSSDAALIDLTWRMAAIGVGMALFNSPNVAAILNATPEGQAGTVGGVKNVARTLGSIIGPAVAALTWELGGSDVAGFHTGVIVMSIFALVGFFVLVLARARGSSTGTTTIDQPSLAGHRLRTEGK